MFRNLHYRLTLVNNIHVFLEGSGLLRKLMIVLLCLLFVLPSVPGYAAREKLTDPLDGQQWVEEENRSYMFFTADIFGDNQPLDVYVVRTKKYDSKKQILFYRGNQLLAQFETSVYALYKARLRDDQHDEIIGISAGGKEWSVSEFLLIGLNDNGEIAPLPITHDPLQPGHPATGRSISMYWHANILLQIDGKTLIIPIFSPNDTKVFITWNTEKRVFVYNLDIPPKAPPVVAPPTLGHDEITLAGISFEDNFWDIMKKLSPGNSDYQSDTKTWEISKRAGDVEFKAQRSISSIHLIIVDGPSFATSRGVRVGDPGDKVIEKYGKPLITEYGNLLLYEYAAVSDPRIVLRFAIKKDTKTVDYISLRNTNV
jgi:hypothetical protein